MKNNDIVRFIKHYMNKDVSRGAIMLTGSWGMGKSYFIRNTLVPEIKRDAEKKCIIISLYGLKTIDEISKNIYFEMRINLIKKQSEVLSTGAIIAKTVAKGVVSYLGFNVSASEEDLMNLYKSINLEGTLIVMEDIERCQINTINLLGFVNNLTEQDGAKVLLVVNEDELLDYQYVDVKDNAQLSTVKKRIPTEETRRYLSVKEKSVNDTIRFEGDIPSAIKDIMGMYNNEVLNKLNTQELAEDVYSIMYLYKCFNLRSLIYSCQKTVDIFDELREEYLKDESLIRTILIGNIIFILRVRSGAELTWGREEYYSTDLGSYSFPLLKFCYDYIVFQKHDYTHVEATRRSLQEKQKYDRNKSNGDKDIAIIQNYYTHTEEQVIQAVESITRRLEDPEDISFYMYGTIATYLIIIKRVLQCDIEEPKRRLVKNMEGRGDKLQIEQIFGTIMDANASEKELEEYRTLRREMEEALFKGISGVEGFDYTPKQLEEFIKRAKENRDRFLSDGGFVRFFDMEKMANLFSECSLEQKNEIRGLFLEMYHSSNIGAYLGADCDNLVKLRAKITKDKDKGNRDRIEKLQYKYFEDNLSGIIEKMS